jgi:protein required for attachment to host cells
MHDMAVEHDWALVADGQRARVFQRRAPGGDWAELESEALTRDEAAPDAEPAFARHLAARLETASAAGRFGRVALVAPPEILAALRGALSPVLAQAVFGTLDQDLTRDAPAAVIEHLAQLHAP